MRVDVDLASEASKPLLDNLLQLYLHDLTDYVPRDLDEDGRRDYKYLDAYWTEPGRFPFIIRVDAAPAGFALVRYDDATRAADMAEFFVVRGHRRRGVAAIAAKAIFDRFAALWEIREMPANTGAQQFWRKVIAEYTGGDFQDLSLNDDHWVGPAQRFDSAHRPAASRAAAKEA